MSVAAAKFPEAVVLKLQNGIHRQWRILQKLVAEYQIKARELKKPNSKTAIKSPKTCGTESTPRMNRVGLNDSLTTPKKLHSKAYVVLERTSNNSLRKSADSNKTKSPQKRKGLIKSPTKNPKSKSPRKLSALKDQSPPRSPQKSPGKKTLPKSASPQRNSAKFRSKTKSPAHNAKTEILLEHKDSTKKVVNRKLAAKKLLTPKVVNISENAEKSQAEKAPKPNKIGTKRKVSKLPKLPIDEKQNGK